METGLQIPYGILPGYFCSNLCWIAGRHQGRGRLMISTSKHQTFLHSSQHKLSPWGIPPFSPQTPRMKRIWKIDNESRSGGLLFYRPGGMLRHRPNKDVTFQVELCWVDAPKTQPSQPFELRINRCTSWMPDLFSEKELQEAILRFSELGNWGEIEDLIIRCFFWNRHRLFAVLACGEAIWHLQMRDRLFEGLCCSDWS